MELMELSAAIVANNYNLFGHDGNAGVVGFSPGPTDIVPSEGLAAILNTTLANNGGPTRTHARVAGAARPLMPARMMLTVRRPTSVGSPPARAGLRHRCL